jgi:hypothetical protein
MIINEGTSNMRVVPDGSTLIKVKCECSCHKVSLLQKEMHYIPCCTSRFIHILAIEHIEKETLTTNDNQTTTTA